VSQAGGRIEARCCLNGCCAGESAARRLYPPGIFEPTSVQKQFVASIELFSIWLGLVHRLTGCPTGAKRIGWVGMSRLSISQECAPWLGRVEVPSSTLSAALLYHENAINEEM
jgi:hypothetical protein